MIKEYDVDKFLEGIEKAPIEMQIGVAIKCLNRFQQSLDPHEAYSIFYDYFTLSHTEIIGK